MYIKISIIIIILCNQGCAQTTDILTQNIPTNIEDYLAEALEFALTVTQPIYNLVVRDILGYVSEIISNTFIGTWIATIRDYIYYYFGEGFIYHFITGFFSHVIALQQYAFGGAIQVIKYLLSYPSMFITELYNQIYGLVTNAIYQGYTGLKKTFENTILNFWAEDTTNKLVKFGDMMFTFLADGVLFLLNGLSGLVLSLGDMLYQGFEYFFGNTGVALYDFIIAVPVMLSEWILGSFQGIEKRFLPLIKSVLNILYGIVTLDFERLGEEFSSLPTNFGEVFIGLYELIRDLGYSTGVLSYGLFGEIFGVLYGIGSGLGYLLNEIGYRLGTNQIFGPLFEDLYNSLYFIGSGLGIFFYNFGIDMYNAFIDAYYKIADAFEFLGISIYDPLKHVAITIANLFIYLSDVGMNLWNHLSIDFSGIFSGLWEILGGMGVVLRDTLSPIYTSLQFLLSGVGGLFLNLGQILYGTVTVDGNLIKQGFEGLTIGLYDNVSTSLVNLSQGVVALFRGLGENLYDGLIQIGPNLINLLRAITTLLIDSLISLGYSFMDGVGQYIIDLFHGIYRIFIYIITLQFLKSYNDVFELAKSAVLVSMDLIVYLNSNVKFILGGLWYGIERSLYRLRVFIFRGGIPNALYFLVKTLFQPVYYLGYAIYNYSGVGMLVETVYSILTYPIMLIYEYLGLTFIGDIVTTVVSSLSSLVNLLTVDLGAQLYNLLYLLLASEYSPLTNLILLPYYLISGLGNLLAIIPQAFYNLYTSNESIRRILDAFYVLGKSIWDVLYGLYSVLTYLFA